MIAVGEVPGPGSGCEGGTVANPIADPGYLCVYVGSVSGLFGNPGAPGLGITTLSDGAQGADTTGAALGGGAAAGGAAQGRGTFAVTAPLDE
jgi:hypothetical protein